MFSDYYNKTRYMQYLSATIATLSIINVGLYVTWPSPALPQLTSRNSPIGVTLTNEEGSWIASSFMLGSVTGFLFSGYLVEKLGRRRTLLLSAIPFTVPWIAFLFVKTALLMCVFRFIGGLGNSIVATGAPMYNGEIAEKDIRGKLATTYNALKITGTLLTLSMGPFVPYRVLILCSAAFPIIFVVLFYFMPETPYYLIKVGKKEEARKNLIILSSNDTSLKTIEDRLSKIEFTVEHDMQNKCTLWEYLSKREYRHSLIIIMGAKSIQQLSGISVIETYLQRIIGLTQSSISPEISSIIAGVIPVPAVLLAGLSVDKMGRKPLMILSCVGCSIALFGEGLYFYLQNVIQMDVSLASWLPTTSLAFYLFMNTLGNTVPFILLGELFPTNIKGVAVATAGFYSSLLSFLAVTLFQPIISKWGIHVCFWMFSAFLILGSIFTWLVQPETKGITFAEIQAILREKKCDKK